MPLVNNTLPTLLCSRPVASNEPVKRSRPTPAALDFPEEPVSGAPPGLDAPADLRIKNTFIEGSALLSPSLETFYRERAVHTCPSKHAGRCLSLLEELTHEIPDTPVRTPLNIQTPCGIQTPLGDTWAHNCASCESRESLYTYPSYSHGGMFPDQTAAAAQVLPDARTASPALVTERPTCMVLSLADVLDRECVGASALQLGSTTQQPALEPQLPHFGFVSVQDAGYVPDRRFEQCVGVVGSPPRYEAPQVQESSRVSQPPSGPALGSPELPSVGSADHAAGRCKPCAFVHTKGCENDLACQFCHLCGPEVRKARRHEKLQQRRDAHRAKKALQEVHHCRTI